MKRLFPILAGLALFAVTNLAAAQAYPNKPIRIILGFPAGSSSDTILRSMTPRMQSELGQSIIIDARPGAASVPAMQAIKTQAPDGYSLINLTSTVAVISAQANPPYDIRKDLTMIGETVALPMYLAVNIEKMPVKTLAELISYIKANPGKLNFSSYGVGSLAHLSLELLSQRLNLSVLHVPYKGSADNARAVAAGDSHATFDVSTVLFPQVEGGRIRIIAVSSENTWPTSPQYPGMKAAGVPDFNAVIWNGLAGPAGMPMDVVRKINAAINAAQKDPLAIDFARKNALQAVPSTPEEFTQTTRKDVETWAAVIKAGNITFN
jgi:tripartite-type tricarboxylate transporter receptor subunit TctC